MPIGTPKTESPGSIIAGAKAMLAVFAADNRGPEGFCFMAGPEAWEEITTLLSRFGGSEQEPTLDGIPVLKSLDLSPRTFLICRAIDWETVSP